MKKILIILLLIISLTSCKSFDHIEDLNGDNDYSLVQITNNDIIKNNSSISLISIFNNTNKGGSVEIEKFSGVKKIANITKKNKLIVSFELSSGNASLCVVSKNAILHYFSPKQDNQVYQINTNEKIYLKLAGESARVNIVYSIE